MTTTVKEKNVKATINVGLIGMGTVGTGVVEFFKKGGGKPFNVVLKKVAVKDLKKTRSIKFSDLTNDPKEILDDKDIDIVVELIGGDHPAKEYIIEAIQKKKSVVTANKFVIARYGKELFALARANAVDLGYEASVAGGIPIIRILNGLAGEKINKIVGILNGTTNYILTRMEEGQSFEEALSLAQKNGFAEANHILDTGGFDARDKLAILSSIVFNTPIYPEKIPCEGITHITNVDFDFAGKHEIEEGKPGYVIKLLASAIRHNGHIELHVYPALLRKDHPLASVRDEFNAIYIEGELTGPQVYEGRGAGRKATTSAVISDILRVAGNIRKGVIDELPTFDEKIKLIPTQNSKRKGYLRVNLKHVPGSGAEVFTILAKHNVNIADTRQRKAYGKKIGGKLFIPDIITTEALEYKNIEQALKEIVQSKKTQGNPVYMRFEE